MIKINGENIDAEALPLMEYLKSNNYKPELIAVECNEEIIPRSNYNELVLHSGDVVEIVSLVGGG